MNPRKCHVASCLDCATQNQSSSLNEDTLEMAESVDRVAIESLRICKDRRNLLFELVNVESEFERRAEL